MVARIEIIVSFYFDHQVPNMISAMILSIQSYVQESLGQKLNESELNRLASKSFSQKMTPTLRPGWQQQFAVTRFTNCCRQCLGVHGDIIQTLLVISLVL